MRASRAFVSASSLQREGFAGPFSVKISDGCGGPPWTALCASGAKEPAARGRRLSERLSLCKDDGHGGGLVSPSALLLAEGIISRVSIAESRVPSVSSAWNTTCSSAP